MIEPQELAAEEDKRRRCMASDETWRQIQEAITWSERQLPVPRNCRESALARQRELLRIWHEQ